MFTVSFCTGTFDPAEMKERHENGHRVSLKEHVISLSISRALIHTAARTDRRYERRMSATALHDYGGKTDGRFLRKEARGTKKGGERGGV